MNKKTKRLTLNRDTVQAMADSALHAALGADPTQSPRSQVDACPTRLCPSLGLPC